MLKNLVNEIAVACFLICCICGTSEFGQQQSKPEADLVITNAKIWTGDNDFGQARATVTLCHSGFRAVRLMPSCLLQTVPTFFASIEPAWPRLAVPGNKLHSTVESRRAIRFVHGFLSDIDVLPIFVMGDNQQVVRRQWQSHLDVFLCEARRAIKRRKLM